MLLIQIAIVAFALFALARTIGQFQKGRVTRGWLGFWLAFWFAAVFVALMPQTADIVARLFGVGRGADFVIYVSLVTLFYLVFRIFLKIEDVERQMTRLVRTDALERFNEEYRDRL